MKTDRREIHTNFFQQLNACNSFQACISNVVSGTEVLVMAYSTPGLKLTSFNKADFDLAQTSMK